MFPIILASSFYMCQNAKNPPNDQSESLLLVQDIRQDDRSCVISN